MFMVPLDNPAQKRTIRPRYAHHQATTWAGFLDPNWDRRFDIFPGSVMTHLGGDLFGPYTGTGKPFGLSSFFVSPTLRIDELNGLTSNLFTVWIGGADSEFEVLAPAFDPSGDWSVPTDGTAKLLTGNAEGLLTPTGANAGNAIVRLLHSTTDKIIVKFLSPQDVAAAPAAP
jgi:hypothetical protein